MTIQTMTEMEVEAVAGLEKQIFSQPWSKESFLDALQGEYTCFLLAKEQERVVGYIGMYLSAPEGEITNVAVDSKCRGNGVGTSLVQAMQKESESSQISQIYLEVRDSNEAAIRLYQKCGFKEVGKRKNFYSFPREDARVMMWQRT